MLCKRHKQVTVVVPQWGKFGLPRVSIIWCETCGSLYNDLEPRWINPKGKPSDANDKLKRIRKILDEPKVIS